MLRTLNEFRIENLVRVFLCLILNCAECLAFFNCLCSPTSPTVLGLGLLLTSKEGTKQPFPNVS